MLQIIVLTTSTSMVLTSGATSVLFKCVSGVHLEVSSKCLILTSLIKIYEYILCKKKFQNRHICMYTHQILRHLRLEHIDCCAH